MHESPFLALVASRCGLENIAAGKSKTIGSGINGAMPSEIARERYPNDGHTSDGEGP